MAEQVVSAIALVGAAEPQELPVDLQRTPASTAPADNRTHQRLRAAPISVGVDTVYATGHARADTTFTQAFPHPDVPHT